MLTRNSIHTFEDNGITYQFYFENEVPCIGTGQSLSCIPGDTSGTLIVPSSFTFEGNKYTLTHIGQYAFYGSMITSLVFPPTIDYMHGGACENLQKVEIIDLSQTKIRTIEEYTFFHCYSLKRLLLPATISSIKRHVFNSTQSLKYIGISSKLKDMDENFCGIICYLEVIFYCGETYNGLVIPQKESIKKVIVPNNYQGNMFSGYPINKTSFNCYFEKASCNARKISYSFSLRISLFLFLAK